jgi:two-component sensor histidine kinase
LVVFGAFIATTHAGPDTPNPTYGEVVIVGAFQLQTYGAVATAAALTGIVDGVAFAVVAAGLYVVSLKAIGTSLRDVIDASHVQGSVGRTLLYLIIGIAFGLYNVLVGRLVSVRRRMFDVLATSRSKGHDRTDAQERARFLSQLHERGLGQLHAVRNALEDTADDLAGEAKERVSGINAYFAATLDAISAGPGEARGDGVTEAVADVLRDVCRTHRLVSVKSHFVELRLEDDRGTELDTYRAERLRDILGEALHNAVKHSCPGQVEIVLARLEGHDFVVVSDPGPLDEPGRGNQLGHEQITRRALACGWRWRWAPACGVGGRSELRLLLAPDAGPLDRINAI